MEDDKKKKSLDPNEIQTDRKEGEVTRRSVLGILGSIAAGGAAAAVIPGCFRVRRAGAYNAGYAAGSGGYSTGVTDSDGGPYADPAGNGRGSRRTAYTGITDSDGGPYADPAGSGRGRAGYTTGITDSDGGPYADPAGNGRGTARHGYTGLTDSDAGPYADPAGSGRGRYYR
jgi:hypothetical protein